MQAIFISPVTICGSVVCTHATPIPTRTYDHRGKVKHLKASDLFSDTLKCHDPSGEHYFLSLARDRITLSSYADDAIRKRVERWADSVPELQKGLQNEG